MIKPKEVKDESLEKGGSATGYHANLPLYESGAEPDLLLTANDQNLNGKKVSPILRPGACRPASYVF